MQNDCRLCGGKLKPVCQLQVLSAFVGDYQICQTCQLLQIVDPPWLQMEFDSSVSACDTGIVQRNLVLAGITTILLRLCRLGDGRFVDYGGGTGMFTRLMRDAGFEFRNHDPYTANLFARGFEWDQESAVDGVTLFEVAEHLEHPQPVFDEIFHDLKAKFLFATTECYPTPFDPDWWYLSRETGQHISLYSPESFRYLARRYGLNYLNYSNFHVLSVPSVATWKLKIAIRHWRRLARFFQKPGLTIADNQEMLERSRNACVFEAPTRFSSPDESTLEHFSPPLANAAAD